MIPRAFAEVAHEAGAGAALEDLVRRAPHVDVADVDAHLLDALGGDLHALGVRSVDLDRERALGGIEAQQPLRLAVSAREPLGRDELHRHEADAADPPEEQAVRHVRDPRHRGEDQRRVDGAGTRPRAAVNEGHAGKFTGRWPSRAARTPAPPGFTRLSTSNDPW